MITIKFYQAHCFLYFWFCVGVAAALASCSSTFECFLHSLGNTSRHFRAVERPLSGRGSVDQLEATEHWHFPGLFRVMRFISSRNTNGPENQVAASIEPGPAIYEFACLFPYLILFLKTNPVNKQISYPRLYKTNQLTRDSESKRLHKISNAEFRTCSGFTWKMPDPS